jgi:hypothetical protein
MTIRRPTTTPPPPTTTTTTKKRAWIIAVLFRQRRLLIAFILGLSIGKIVFSSSPSPFSLSYLPEVDDSPQQQPLKQQNQQFQTDSNQYDIISSINFIKMTMVVVLIIMLESFLQRIHPSFEYIKMELIL